MKRLLLITVVVLVLACATAGLAFADNGPHGGYTTTTDACAGCHRAHTAVGPNLLLSTSTDALCLSCHGATATGADTDVSDGVYLERDAETEDPAEGVANRGLKGGGFINAVMNTDEGTSATSASTTSSHTYDGNAGTAWGNGAINSGAGAAINLDCANCHNPHGRAGAGNAATYRILRPVPYDSGAAGAVNVTDEDPKTYTVASPTGRYYGQSYDEAVDLASWCSQCHTRYLAGSGAGSTDSGDDIFAYRHMSDASSVSCLRCHVAHGTSAAMGEYSGGVAWPDATTSPSGDARSSLLRVNNRGVCQLCHNK